MSMHCEDPQHDHDRNGEMWHRWEVKGVRFAARCPAHTPQPKPRRDKHAPAPEREDWRNR